MGLGTIWTEEEKQVIKDNKELTAKEIHEKFLPNRTIPAIHARRKIMGLVSEIKKRWDFNEDEILRQRYNDSINNLIKALPNRSDLSIRGRIVALGLQRREVQNSKRIEKLYML